MRRIALHLIALSVVVLFTSPAHAEWVRISEFGGVVTTVTPSEVGIENARLMTGWYPQRGDLLQMTFEKRDTLTGAAPANGVFFLAPHDNTKSILWSCGGEVVAYSITADGSVNLVTGTSDTCSTIADSNVVYYAGADIARSRWLNMVLADNASGSRRSIDIGGAYATTRMFLSDTAVLLIADQSATATDTMTWMKTLSGGVSQRVGYFAYGDSLALIDGENRSVYNGRDFGTVTWPLYSDSGTYDSIGTDAAGDNGGQAIGDSLLVYGDFDDHTGGFFLWSDNTDSAHAIPFHIAAHLSDGLASEHLSLVGDSSAFRKDDGSGFYDDHFDNKSKRYIIYDHGLGSYNENLSYFLLDLRLWQMTYTDGGEILCRRFDTIAVYDDGTILRRARVGNWAPAWMYDTRAMDGAIYRADPTPDGGSYSGVYGYSMRVERTFGLDSLYLLTWGKGGSGWSWVGPGGGAPYGPVYLRIHRLPPAPYSVSATQTAFQYDVCIPQPHRDRAWYAKDNKIAYSDLNDWYNVAGGGVVTFQKDVTALSSFGNEMVAHLDGNEIQIWTGYAEGDFYKAPAPVGIAAMNQGSVAHSDRDNADYFPHPLGLWKYTSGSVSEVPVAAKEIFTDSVNWEASEQLVGAIYDDKYWFGYPQKPNTTNNRLVVFDLETSDATFIGRIHPGSFYVRTDPEVGQQLWIGDADSAVIWLANSGVNEVPMSSEMRSGWFVGDDRWQRKLVREYTVGYEAKRGDTLMVDFYTGSEDAVWADTIVVTTGAGQTFGNTTTESTNEEITPLQIYGSVYTPLTSGFLDSCRFYLDWTGLEGAEACSVKVAAYTYNNGSPVLVDSCYMLVFSGGEDDGEKTFTFSTTNTQITAGTKYVLFMRATEDDFTLALKKDNTTGTMLTETAMYPNQSITGSWVPYMHTPSPFYLVETSDELQSYVYYSERVVQQHHAVVPRAVQGKVWSYGLRSPSKGMRVLDIAVNWVPRGRERTQ